MTTESQSKRRDPVATRRAILEAAETLFVDRGFAATSMNDIAKQAGVTKSLIHHHFGSKQDLWVELKRYLLAHYAEVQMGLLATKSDGQDLLQQSTETLFSFLRDHPGFVRLSSWMDLEQDRGGLADQAYPDLVVSGIERVRAEQQAGRMRSDIEPAHVIAAMVSLCSHWFRARSEFETFYEGPIEDRDESYQRAIVEILATGVSPQPIREE